MKKLRKHFMVLFLFLLFGVTILSLSTNGAFASVFSWLQSTPTAESTVPSQAASTQKTANRSELQDTADNLFMSPIDAARQSIKHAVFMGDAADDPTSGNASDFGGGYSSPLTGTAYRAGSGHRATGPVDIPVTITPGDPAENTPGNNGSVTDPNAANPGKTPSTPGNTPGSNDGGNTGGNIIFPGGHSGGHHSRTVSITGVTIDKTELVLLKGESAALTATVAPSNTTQSKIITWSSSDDTIATVDTVGKVTAVKGGTAIITAKASNGKTAVCNVTVSIPATAVSLSLSDTPVERGQTLQLTAKLTPEDSTDKVLWATSDNSIAKVDVDGKVTGVAPGTAYIIAAVGDGSISVSCKITTVVSIARLALSDDKYTIKKGEDHQLTAQVLPEDTTEDKTVSWSSSDPTVATVDDTGKITAVEGGTAIITAQTGKHSAQCTVTVTVPVTGITLDKTVLTLARGTTCTLTPTLTPVDATDTAVDWTSSDETVATVNDDGSVTAISAGQAIITVKALDGGFTAHCKVTVIVPISKVTVDKGEMTLNKGETVLLTATIEPTDTTQDKTITWATSDSSVASVDATGKVTAVGGGNAVVTATTTNGKKADCKCTILVPVTGVSLNRSSLEIQKGTNQTLQAIFTPSDATDKQVHWASSNPNVAAIDEAGIISAIRVGQTTISVTTNDGGFLAKCSISVTCRVTGLSFSQAEYTLSKGSTVQKLPIFDPIDATDKVLTWSSSDTSVASVNSSGIVTANGEGTAVITAKSHDGNHSAQYTIHAYVPVDSINLYRSSIRILRGSTYSLLKEIRPTDASSKSLEWTSSIPSVATVDSSGKITALNTGSTYISAKAANSSLQTGCWINVVSTVHYTAVETSRHESSSSGGDYDKKMIGTPSGTYVDLNSTASCSTTWHGNSGSTSYSNNIASIQFNLDTIVSIDQIQIREWRQSYLSSHWSDDSYARLSDSYSSSKSGASDRKSTLLTFTSNGGIDTIEFIADLDTNKDSGSGSLHTSLDWTNMTFSVNGTTITPVYDGFIS